MRASIITPTTNLDKTIRGVEKLKNCFEQYFEYVECIIVVDGVRGEGFEDDDIRVHYNSELIGSYRSRNKGVTLARHECLIFIDDGVEITIKNDFLIPSGDAFFLGGVVDFIGNASDLYEFWYENNAFPMKKYLIKNKFIPTIFLMVHRNLFDKICGFDDELFSSGDVDLGNKASKHANLSIDQSLIVTTDRRNKKQIYRTIQRQIFGQCHQRYKARPKRSIYILYVISRIVVNLTGLSGIVKSNSKFGVLNGFLVNYHICMWKVKFLIVSLFENPNNLSLRVQSANLKEVINDKKL